MIIAFATTVKFPLDIEPNAEILMLVHNILEEALFTVNALNPEVTLRVFLITRFLLESLKSTGVAVVPNSCNPCILYTLPDNCICPYALVTLSLKVAAPSKLA